MKAARLPKFGSAVVLRVPVAVGNAARRISNNSAGGNDYDYGDVVKNFRWNLPAKFNFAQDVIDARAASDPDLLALHYISDGSGGSSTEVKWTYGDLSLRSRQCASALRDELGELKRALTILPRVPEWWLLNVAAMRNGTVLLPGTTLLTVKDIEQRLEKSEADVVVGDLEVARKVELLRQKPKHKVLVTREEDSASDTLQMVNRGWVLLSELLARNGEKAVEPRETSSSEIIQIFFTSGTTGTPKMVPHTQGSYGYCHWVTGRFWLDLTPTDLHWNVADTGWAKSAWASVFGPWSQGAAVFVHGMPRFTPKEVLRVVDNYEISTLCAPPTLFRAMVLEDLTLYSFRHLRHCVSAGEPLNEEVIHSWQAATGHTIREAYGQTETTLLAGNFKGVKVRPGSMGKVAPGYDVRIVDGKGQEVPRNTHGNLGIKCAPERPPGLFTEYLNSPDKTRSAFVGDFYLTGDRAFMDDDDYFWFVARDDDIIISAGYRIGPFEVESALLEHPSVAESAVVASPDASRGHVVKAFVVPTAKESIQLAAVEGRQVELIAELQDFVRKRTAPYKYPRRIEFVDCLPKTVSGKIKRAELRHREMRGEKIV